MSLRHVRHLPAQLPVIAALGSTLLRRRGDKATLGRELVETLAPPQPALVRDYIEHVGGDPAAYRSTIPPHLFPHWSFPLAAKTLAGLPYPLTRIINAGCKLDLRAPLPANTPLIVRASLTSIDDDGHRVLLTQRIVTGTAQTPDAVVATITALIPLRSNRAGTIGTGRNGSSNGANGASGLNGRTSHDAKVSRHVPYQAHELARWSLAHDSGLAFAVLTGDFNPIHWLARAGVAAGFGGPILHGFAMLARAYEGIARTRFAGDVSGPRTIEARFTRPLRLPADVSLFALGNEAWLADAPGTAPYLAMTIGRHE